MSPKDKIFSVLKTIKEKSEISPNEEWVEFKLNENPPVVGVGILSFEEEKNILSKLQNEKAIKLHVIEEPDEEGRYSTYTAWEFMSEFGAVLVEILADFKKVYTKYQSRDNGINWLYYTNPFWLFLKLVLFFWRMIKLIWKHKIISFITALITLLAIDYSLAWRNLKYIINIIL